MFSKKFWDNSPFLFRRKCDFFYLNQRRRKGSEGISKRAQNGNKSQRKSVFGLSESAINIRALSESGKLKIKIREVKMEQKILTTDEKIQAIEKLFNRPIRDLMETYELTVDQLYLSVEEKFAAGERQEQETAIYERRQKEIDANESDRRKQAESRFKAISQSRFFEANPIADETDFEKLYPQIRNEYLIENYRRLAAKETTRSAKGYEG